MGMNTTNNWVKDGLDAYLAVTGEHRAEKKAEADLAERKQGMQMQVEQLQLAKNQDSRAAMSAGLNSQLTQQQISKGKREEDEAEKWDNLLFEEGYKKEHANPHTVTAQTIKDPAQVEASKYVYNNSLKAVEYIRNLPPEMNRISLPAEQPSTLPGFVRDTAMNIFTPAAAKRAGQQSLDPVTGKMGVLTGKVGHINIERDANGEGFLSGDMEVKNEDGTIRYAPFTNRTDDPNQPIKRVPLAALEKEAQAVLQGTDDALQSGIDPSVAITARKLEGMKEWPIELKKKFYQNLIDEDKNLRTRESDVATTKKVGKALESLKGDIDGLPWKTDPHGSTVQLYTTLSQSGMTTAEVEKAAKMVVSAKVPNAQNLKIEEVGAGGNMAQKVIVGADGKLIPIGKPYQKHASPAGGTKTHSKIEEINALVKNGMPRDEANATVYGLTKQESALTAKYYGILDKANQEKVVSAPEQMKSEDELMDMAVNMANREKTMQAGNRIQGDASKHMPLPAPGTQQYTAGTKNPQARGLTLVKQPAQAAPSPKAITAVNPQTQQRIVSYDNGRSWQPATK